MAKILFLDDNEMRHNIVHAFHDGFHEIVSVWNVEDCISKLSAENWDVVSLDNDLGPGMLEGREVANWLEENSHFIPRQVLLHTNNYVAAAAMRAAIPHAVESSWWNKPEPN